MVNLFDDWLIVNTKNQIKFPALKFNKGSIELATKVWETYELYLPTFLLLCKIKYYYLYSFNIFENRTFEFSVEMPLPDCYSLLIPDSHRIHPDSITPIDVLFPYTEPSRYFQLTQSWDDKTKTAKIDGKVTMVGFCAGLQNLDWLEFGLLKRGIEFE